MARETFKNHLHYDKIFALISEIFQKAGLSRDHAEAVTDNFLMADLRGVSSHGISRIMVYCTRVASGLINPNPDIRIVKEAPAAVTFDGDNGMGVVVGTKAMEDCIERAGQYGIAAAAVRNSNHYGIAAYYAFMAAEKGMIGMSFTTAPPSIAPWGGMEPMFGTNPICIVVPAKKYRPLVFDAATSVVARGKINLADIEGTDIPEGWAVTREGYPTTDPKEALSGIMLPFGTYKGSALTMMVAILCSELSGGLTNPELPNLYSNLDRKQEVGHFFVAMDVSKFTEYDDFVERVDSLIDKIKANPVRPDMDRLYYSGEIEYENEDFFREHGIGCGDGVLRDIATLCEKFGIPAQRVTDCIKK